MDWLISAILAIVFLSAYNFAFKSSSSEISNFYGVPFVAGGALLTGLAAVALIKFFRVGSLYTNKGALLASAAGIIYGIGLLFCFVVYAKNTPLSIGMPVLIGGTMLVGSVLGIIFLKEPITLLKLLGISAILIGVILLARK